MMNFNRREFIRIASAGILGGQTFTSALAKTSAETRQSAKDRPNIIFILADDLGYGDLGCFGQDKILTPNIDKMAAEGVRFTDCYAGSTVCAPSRCCLMTGLHTGHARVRGNERVPLRPEDLTVAETLQKAGYQTGIIGKWGLGEPDTTGIPNKKGFVSWFGYLNQRHAHNYYPEKLWRNQEFVSIEGNTTNPKGAYSHDLFTNEALKFIEQHQQGPFFLFLAYTIPHANNELGQETGDGMEVPDAAPYTMQSWPTLEKKFAAMITRLDRDIGRIMTLLRSLGLDERTIVFFSSDNGPHREGGHDAKYFHSSGQLRGTKRDLYEGGIRVPMLVRWANRIKPGTVSNHPWAFWDFLPTAAELAEVPSPLGIDGISVLPTLLGKKQKGHEYLYWEFHEGGFKQAIRMGNWKAVRLGPEKSLELFNLETDIAEHDDVAPDNPEVVVQIERALAAARIESEYWPAKK